ncbi:glycoside hydrolase family 88 protein [Granulicatella seriolae]|uniref:Glycoside hydrolase family 88 protein n=1 Tax=Granulicatella seriolae TaxID=2967226 RepID=A0ABT1WRJ5_9LACT|nr:glycoside hydrolase family 88 protein [Granulicatella seriolae]
MAERISQMNWVADELFRIDHKMQAQLKRIGNGIPYISLKGNYDNKLKTDIAWWTNGFYGGVNWQLFSITGNKIYKEKAINLENQLDLALSEFEHLHHDVGFMWLPTSVIHNKLLPNRRSYQRSIHAANILAARYNSKGQFIRAWNREQTEVDCSGWVIIDSMMNIPLLFWASLELDDPRFKQIAVNHAHSIARNLVREDGSVNHIGVFDAYTGDFLESQGGQGFSSDSSWSRGQAWAIYGFALTYKYTEDAFFLNVAKKVAHYVLSHLAQTDYLARIDFRAPKTTEDTDASATAIIACGLLEISNHVEGNEKAFYQDNAIKILEKLSEIANYDDNYDGIIHGCAVRYHDELEKNSSLIYADHYYIEGLLKLIGKELEIW